MGRPRRNALGGFIYHVLNRGNGRLPIFHKDADYLAFLEVLAETQAHVPGMRLLAYCLMPNHWHLVLWPKADGELSDFMHWLTLTHTQRWHAHYQNIGGGHLYQGRFKSFPVENDEHYLTVCRYVERNALRAGFVRRAENWRWNSLAQRNAEPSDSAPTLSDGPLPWPRNWLEQVNRPLTEKELDAVRRSLERGQPYGNDAWINRAAGQLGLASTLRPCGRPRKRRKRVLTPFSAPTLSDGPLPWPRNWLEQVNRPLTEKELDAVRRSLERGQPYGNDAWIRRAVGQLGLASTLRPRGRPRKGTKKGS